MIKKPYPRLLQVLGQRYRQAAVGMARAQRRAGGYADEEDPEKLVEIIREIIGMLIEKAERLFMQREEKLIKTKVN